MTAETEQEKAEWQWPDFIKPGVWIARDRSGCWYEHCGGKPSLDEANGVWGRGHELSYLSPLYESGLYIDPPEIEDWRDTLIQKPIETAS